MDGSCIQTISQGGIGGVLRDENGAFRGAVAKPVPATASAKQTELYAIKKGLILLNTLHTSNVVIETDCSEAIACISDMHGTYTGLEGLLHDIRSSLAALQNVFLQRTPRNCNGVAHRLAATADESPEHLIWLHHILDVLNYDVLHMSG